MFSGEPPTNLPCTICPVFNSSVSPSATRAGALLEMTKPATPTNSGFQIVDLNREGTDASAPSFMAIFSQSRATLA